MCNNPKMTSEQIENRRRVLGGKFGAAALYLSKEQIQKIRDRIQAQADQMSYDTALNKAIDFIREQNYTGEIVLLSIEQREGYTHVMCLEPNGLFIVCHDGTVKDNYQVFEKQN